MILLAALVGIAQVRAGPDFDRIERIAQGRYGDAGADTVRQWRQLLVTAADLSETERLERANRFFNDRIVFDDDQEIWGDPDYWATPLEVMGALQGDCEDFSIAKYMTLVLLGVPVEKLRLVYVKATLGGPTSRVTQAHMVVAYYPRTTATPLILDNLVAEILPADRRPDLVPVFSFNSAGLWVGQDDQPTDTKPELRLSRWRDVLRRMQDEGIH